MSTRALLCVTALLVVLVSASGSASAAIVFTVNSVGDGSDANPTDGVCADTTGACTLRAAIQQANATVSTTEATQIHFNIPSGPLTIVTGSQIVATGPVDIDGSTQPGYAGTPIVQVRAAGSTIGGSGSNNGIVLNGGSSRVAGLMLNHLFDAIDVNSSGNRIEDNFIGLNATGTTADRNERGIRIFSGSQNSIERNVITVAGALGVEIDSLSSGNVMRANKFGTNAAGTSPLPSAGQATNLLLGSDGDVVGGTSPASRNLFGGTVFVEVTSAGAVVQGNYFGTDSTGQNRLAPQTLGPFIDRGTDTTIGSAEGVTPRGPCTGACNLIATILFLEGTDATVQGNFIGSDVDGEVSFGSFANPGISIGGNDNLIGGTQSGEGNLISGNNGHGITFQAVSPSRNRIVGNLIGTDATGENALPNGFSGVSCCVLLGSANVLGGVESGAGNTIAYNRGDGVTIFPGSFVNGPVLSILGNSIHSNGGLGIELPGGTGPTPNDLAPPCPSPPGPDCDQGPNDIQNYPVITRVGSSGGQTVADVEFDSTPDTDFRLEFFRNAACDSSDFGEGQVFVGAHMRRTNAEGKWSGEVALSGETLATELITATATRFTEPAPSLVGSTSEFSECLADLSITKIDEPDPVAIGQPLTYSIDVVNHGPAPATAVRVTDTLPSGVTVTSITPSQGSCSRSGSTVTCLLGLVARDGSARITIVLNPGTTPRTITNSTQVSSELRDPDASDNSALATTQVVTGATIIVEKQSEPDGSPQKFSFSGAITASLADAESETITVTPGTHTVSEAVPAGWDATAIRCEDPTGDSAGSAVPVGPGGTATATYRVAAGETVKCTFTNTQRGSVTLRKTTNGVVDPSKDILFVLTGPGLPTAGLTRSTFGDQDGILEWPSLVPGQYKVCESPVPAGFTSFWKLDGVIVTPYNPDASKNPPEDLGTRCYDFSVSPGQARAFEVDNSRPGGDPRTIGYWKNWNRCTGGNQSATAQKNGGAAAGFFLVEDLLPQTIGDFSITTCEQAVKLLSKQDQAGRNRASDAAYELGAQLLAARLNLAAGAETCSAVQQAVLDGQTLLDGINFTGSGDYLGSKSKDPKRPQALSLAATLDRYNNGTLC
jgi:uncharacterized repeat protein (TIGR01451 family)/CSLREA domain-containing protein